MNRPILYRFANNDFAFCGRVCALLFRWLPSMPQWVKHKPQAGEGCCVWCGMEIGDIRFITETAERL